MMKRHDWGGEGRDVKVAVSMTDIFLNEYRENMAFANFIVYWRCPVV
jgi:hypothetical protein